jgi:peptidoglycan L-alanyl-D-glutamate endopeptidase CwlK
MAEAMVAHCDAVGIDLLITSTYRDFDAQAALYAQGRTKPGGKVTNARPGQSWHNWRRAFDVVPLRGGKPVWDVGDLVWYQVGAIGEELGLEWAGRWKRFPEFPHFQLLAGRSLQGMIATYPKGLPHGTI